MNASKAIFRPSSHRSAPDYGVDRELLLAQCRWLQSNNVGLASLGTNSEANSLSPDERYDIIESLVQAGLLVELDEAQRRSLIGQLGQAGFTMPGIAGEES